MFIIKRSILIWQLLGYTVTAILGTILHFLYEWTGGAIWTAPISGINESTWEHMKLFFFPAFLFAIFQYFFFNEINNFWLIKLKGTLLGLMLIPIIFYTYNGVIGKSPDWFNIAIFFISTGLCYLYEGIQIKKAKSYKLNYNLLSILVFCVIAFCFILFTFYTPRLEIFKDPITGSFGI